MEQTKTSEEASGDSEFTRLKNILLKPPAQRTDSEVETVVNSTKNCKFFKELNDPDKKVHKESCQRMFYQKYSQDSYVFKFREVGDCFYIILKGTVGVRIPKYNEETEKMEEIEVTTLSDGIGFGELALEKRATRAASIYCNTVCHFAVLDKASYKSIISNILKEKQKQLVYFLKSLSVFKNWNKLGLIKILYNFEEKKFIRNSLVFREGTRVDSVYIVKEGEFCLKKKIRVEDEQETLGRSNKFQVKKPKSQTVNLVILGRGEFIGQSDAMNENTYTSSCVCNSTEGLLLRTSKEYFVKIFSYGDLGSYFKKTNSVKIKSLNNRIKMISSLEREMNSSPKESKVPKPKEPKESLKLKLLRKRVVPRIEVNHTETTRMETDYSEPRKNTSGRALKRLSPRINSVFRNLEYLDKSSSVIGDTDSPERTSTVLNVHSITPQSRFGSVDSHQPEGILASIKLPDVKLLKRSFKFAKKKPNKGLNHKSFVN